MAAYGRQLNRKQETKVPQNLQISWSTSNNKDRTTLYLLISKSFDLVTTSEIFHIPAKEYVFCLLDKESTP